MSYSWRKELIMSVDFGKFATSTESASITWDAKLIAIFKVEANFEWLLRQTIRINNDLLYFQIVVCRQEKQFVFCADSEWHECSYVQTSQGIGHVAWSKQ